MTQPLPNGKPVYPVWAAGHIVGLTSSLKDAEQLREDMKLAGMLPVDIDLMIFPDDVPIAISYKVNNPYDFRVHFRNKPLEPVEGYHTTELTLNVDDLYRLSQEIVLSRVTT